VHCICDVLSERAAFLGTVNTVRRDAQGRWHGDMFDGLGYVRAMEKNGCTLKNKRALLLAQAAQLSHCAQLGVGGRKRVAIHDPDANDHRLPIES